MYKIKQQKYTYKLSEMSSSLQKTQIIIDPNYLIQLSKMVETLSHFYVQQNLPSLSAQYRNVLITIFSSLSQSLQLYNNSSDASSMISAAIIKSKAELQIYCLDKVSNLLRRETQQLGGIVATIVQGYRNSIMDFQKALLSQRSKRIETSENQKDKIIQKFRQELIHRKQYIAQLRSRVDQAELDNIKMYQYKIQNVKNLSARGTSLSPRKNNNLSLNQSLSKLKIQNNSGSAHKIVSSKPTLQTIIDIMETKQKQQSAKGKKTSLRNFLKTYFRYKFGMKDLSEQAEQKFKQDVQSFIQKQEKSMLILFNKMYSEDCQQQYYWQQKSFYDRLVRILKRYLNEKEGISLDQLQRLYGSKIVDQRFDVYLNQKDIQYILINIYKTSQVESLQMIFNEILMIRNKKQSYEQDINAQNTGISSKKLINQILNYQLSRHLSKIQDIVRTIKQVDGGSRGQLNQQQLQTVIARLRISQDKIQLNNEYINEFYGKFITYSQCIEAIEKIRKSKPRKSK